MASLPSTVMARDGPCTAIWHTLAVLKQTRATSSTSRQDWMMRPPEPPYSGGISVPK